MNPLTALANRRLEELYDRASLTDPVVRKMRDAGYTPAATVGALVQEKKELLRRITELEAIRPRKTVIDGKVFVWHCPDELIPE